jgi:hypothetical protein
LRPSTSTFDDDRDSRAGHCHATIHKTAVAAPYRQLYARRCAISGAEPE